MRDLSLSAVSRTFRPAEGWPTGYATIRLMKLAGGGEDPPATIAISVHVAQLAEFLEKRKMPLRITPKPTGGNIRAFTIMTALRLSHALGFGLSEVVMTGEDRAVCLNLTRPWSQMVGALMPRDQQAEELMEQSFYLA